MIWQQILLWVISTLISSALQPKPDKPKAAALGDFSVPTAEEGLEFGILFGTGLLAPNTCWYGDLRTIAIKSGGGKK